MRRQQASLSGRWNAIHRRQKPAAPIEFVALELRVQQIAGNARQFYTESKQKRQLAQVGGRDLQMAAYLGRYRIKPGEIPNIGPARVQQLQSFGIETACGYYKKAQSGPVPGFGRSLTSDLVDWRRRKEQGFRYNRARPIDQATLRKIRMQSNVPLQLMSREIKKIRTETDKLKTWVSSLKTVQAQSQQELNEIADRHARVSGAMRMYR